MKANGNFNTFIPIYQTTRQKQRNLMFLWESKQSNSVEISPSGEASSCVTTLGLPKMLWNPNIYYHVHNNCPLVSVLNQINSVHTPHPKSLRPISILYTHLRIGLSPSGFPTNILYPFLFLTIRAKSPAKFFAESQTPYAELGFFVGFCRKESE